MLRVALVGLSLLNFAFADSIQVYLNSPLEFDSPRSDTTSKIGVALINLIKESKTSLDFAIYGAGNQDEIITELIKAKDRGVRIRGVVDKDINDTNYYSDTQKLIEIFGKEAIKSDYEIDKLIKKKKICFKC